jgi:hypothetical protein
MPEISALKQIHLRWEGPFLFEKAKAASTAEDYGVYAIYGTHDVFGPDALLYFGQANQNPFPSRIENHYKRWCQWESSEVAFYFGRIITRQPISDEEWGAQVAHAEGLLIYYLTPPYNERGKKNLSVTVPTLLLNYGRRHRLPWCLTNLPDLIDLNEFKPCRPKNSAQSG